jgi:hypothetical protein
MWILPARRLSLVALVAGLLAGCLEVSGGAVEIAWVLRDDAQGSADCTDADPDLHTLRLSIVPVSGDPTDLCATGAVKGCQFSCQESAGSGITAFAVPPGDYFLGLVPETVDGTPLAANRVAVPTPVRRTVRTGELCDLGLWQVVILGSP